MMPVYRVVYEWAPHVRATNPYQAIQAAEEERLSNVPDDVIVGELKVARVEEVPEDTAEDMSKESHESNR